MRREDRQVYLAGAAPDDALLRAAKLPVPVASDLVSALTVPRASSRSRVASAATETLVTLAGTVPVFLPAVALELAERGAARELIGLPGVASGAFRTIACALEHDSSLSLDELRAVAASDYAAALIPRCFLELPERDTLELVVPRLSDAEAADLAARRTAPVHALAVLAAVGPRAANAVVRDPRTPAAVLALIAARTDDASAHAVALALEHANVDGWQSRTTTDRATR
ncbi:MAG: hypothetical protein ACTHK1_05235 [Actinomycetales bacterium]